MGLLDGRVQNSSSRELWVVETDTNPDCAVAHRLVPGWRSPANIDADGFRAVDGTPIDGHLSWVKIIDLSTAEVRDSGTELTRGCLLCTEVGDDEFGPVTFDDAKGWGKRLE